MEVLPMAEDKSTQIARPKPIPDDDGSPRMVTLCRGSKELAAVGAAGAEDAQRQASILILQQEGGLRIGDVIQVSRI
jgi:hypothetical protein